MNRQFRNLDIAELVRHDIAHHFHPFTDHKTFHAEGGAARHHPCRRRVDLGRQRQQDSRRHGGSVVRQCRLWPQGAGRGRLPADARSSLLQHLLQDDDGAGDRACGEDLRPACPSASSTSSSSIRARKPTTRSCASCATTGSSRASRIATMFIGRRRGYHGSTMIAASLGGMQGMHEQGGLPLPGFHHVQQPYWYDFGGDLSPRNSACKPPRDVEKKILEVGPDNVAAFIGEPIQGAAGVLIPPPTYWPEVQNDLPEIRHPADRRRSDLRLRPHRQLVGFRDHGLRARHRADGQGTVVGLSADRRRRLRRRRSSGLLRQGRRVLSRHDLFRPSGGLRRCAGEHRILERRNWSSGCSELAPYFARAAGEPGRSSDRRRNALGQGLIGAIELTSDKSTRERFADPGRVGTICRDHCFNNGLIMRACWDTMVLAPPLVHLQEGDRRDG